MIATPNTGTLQDIAKIPRALNEQQKEIEVLIELVNKLQEKLQPVLRNEPKETDPQENEFKTNIESSVPLVTLINQRTRDIRMVIIKLNDIYDSAEC